MDGRTGHRGLMLKLYRHTRVERSSAVPVTGHEKCILRISRAKVDMHLVHKAAAVAADVIVSVRCADRILAPRAALAAIGLLAGRALSSERDGEPARVDTSRHEARLGLVVVAIDSSAGYSMAVVSECARAQAEALAGD